MSLYEKYKTSLDKVYQESMNQLMDEETFYDATKKQFDILESQIDGLGNAKAQTILSKSLINRILKVHNRIILIRDLAAKMSYADNIIQVYMYPGLVTYLYLTCFDQLGTPIKGWYFFPAWIDSTSCESEVEDVINSATEKFGIDDFDERKAMIQDVYNQYHEMYGVKNSFFRFLREILPEERRDVLFNSILVEKWTDDNEQVLPYNVSEVYKEKWLYETRNNYTHNLFTTETNVTDGKFIGEEKWLIREKILKEDGTIVIWVMDNFNLTLEDCILRGIQVLIEGN